VAWLVIYSALDIKDVKGLVLYLKPSSNTCLAAGLPRFHRGVRSPSWQEKAFLRQMSSSAFIPPAAEYSNIPTHPKHVYVESHPTDITG
jgi:hypothetical protein